MRTKAIGAGGIAVAVGLGAVVLVYALLQSAAPGVQDVLAVYQEQADYEVIAVAYPADGTVFPPEMVAPTMQWQDENPRCDRWLVRIEFLDGTAPLNRTPPSQDWELIKQRSLERDVRICILGFASAGGVEILSRAKVSIRTSGDEVGAPLFYREVNLPFIDAVKDPSRIRWRFGPISSPQPPPVVLQNLPVCGNCHSFDADGATLAMDVDYANSKGSYVITRVKEEMTLAASDIITWNDRRPLRRQHCQGQVRLRAQTGAGLLAVVLPDQGDSLHLRQENEDVQRPARRRRPGAGPEQSHVEPRRQDHRLRPGPGLRSQAHARPGQSAADPRGMQGVRRGRKTLSVRPVSDPLQRRQRRDTGAHRGRLAQRREQFLRALLARRSLDRVLPGQELHASTARQRAVRYSGRGRYRPAAPLQHRPHESSGWSSAPRPARTTRNSV